MKNFLQRRNNDWVDFFGDTFDDFFRPAFPKSGDMKTDIKETETGYELAVDMAGFDKKDINLTLNNGYLTIEAKREEKEEEKDSYLRRERSFSCSRSYFVGENIKEEDITAKYTNGTLHLSVPKNENKELPAKHIEIE